MQALCSHELALKCIACERRIVVLNADVSQTEGHAVTDCLCLILALQSVAGGSVVFTTIDHPIMRDMRCHASSSSSNSNDSTDAAATNSSSSKSNTDSISNSSSNSEVQEVEVLPSGVLIEADVSATSPNETPSKVTTSRVTVVMHWDCKGALQRCVLLSTSFKIQLRKCHVH
jgi:hypothetical protein